MSTQTTNGLAKPDFSNVPVASLESLRLRLAQLTHSLAKLSDAMQQSQTLPHWSSLQNQFSVILSQLTSLSSTLDANYDVLKSTNVFPTVEFPTTQQEGLLTTLLRKKHLPEVSEWINENHKSEAGDVRGDDAFSSWCTETAGEVLKSYNFEGYKTQKEIESGTELGPEFEDENEQEDTPGPVPGLSVSQMLRFVYQGNDWES